MKVFLRAFFEQMFFAPKWYHFPIILLLLPFSILYGVLMSLRRMLVTKKDFGIPIVSVGNLIVGGSGKTPFVIALASMFKNVTIISRGYGRKSQGLVEVSRNGEILVDVTQSGDEPMLMASSLTQASVIVSEERHEAIVLAKKQGAKLIILDDGFNRVEIKKFEILLEPQNIKNYLPFPSGAFREFYFNRKYADIIVKEDDDFKRVVSFEDLRERMVLVTAISNPVRLDQYLPEGVVEKVYLDDHAYFDEQRLKTILEEQNASSLLCTSKDKVKMEGFKLAISEMKLKLEIKDEVFIKIEDYIQNYK
ncbi:tetraacyldisaccharide 4'-kinase [Sulfurovum sp. CS9]|uniref:tetraacyldisaccharide 4'-kinase n=1 Tax=Sulfurovum sp. CS9 TaxID=3391146 RepID=UPI0039EBB245